MSRRNGHQEPKRDPEDQELHGVNVRRPPDDEGRGPETLKFIAEPDDEVEPPVDGLGWLSGKSISTANFEEEDVRSREWVIEFYALLSQLERPTAEGLSGHRRAWAFDDPDATAEPLSPTEQLQVHGAGEVGKEAATRAKEGWATETGTADTRESIVRNPDDEGQDSRGGILSRIRGR